ncbi:STAS domain-containing protein [Rhodoferax sp.]|uniref:STAS domain-containing protein n=1 Tax=Rhodoferax sp. TaxID=50421 RepID=UPI0028419691|nr:STAS domain-containing protein [Rhodoferax sp.]MDR3371482.1 STAS domain-containing protein [Rhodoferax sp.]
MVTKDTPSGLLAKVASLVRSPPANSKLNSVSDAPDEGVSGKQAIKRMIARKAHNDAVRQREFSQLRKLREASPDALSELAARPSFYQDTSGFAASGGRQSTLKKIDEIEAQMSKQWWKGQQSRPTETVSPSKPQPVPASESGASQLDTCNTFAPTMQTNLGESTLTVRSNAPPAHRADKLADKSRSQTSRHAGNSVMGSGFSSSMMESIDMGQSLSDPVLEDAAIRFANGDDEGAESVLTLALKGNAEQVSRDIWITALLDMYRTTGQQTKYDQLAMDYAQRSGRGAPSLISVQQPVDAVMSIRSPAQPSSATAGFVVWHSPAVLDIPSVDRLQACVVTGRPHTRLDWQALKIITPEAAEALSSVMEGWCDQPLTLQFENLEMLDGLLRVNTPVGDRQVAQFWWQLRMNALRVLGSQEEFELVSMDYCITYEVSPPAWQSARCHRAYGSYRTSQVMDWAKDDNQQNTVSENLTEAMPFVNASANRVELVGDVLGTVAAELTPLQSALQLDGDLLVSCESLVRVDFSAAGSILNWVASAQARGQKIEFCCLPHLVAAFFNLIGINEHARVTVKAN